MLQYSDKQIYILVDDNTKQYCLPIFLELLQEKYGWNINSSHIFTISPGEVYKTIDTVCTIWHAMVEQNVTRSALLFNLGGGVITDLGGFVASTYRRGIDYVNVPTTLLSMVDAGYGGKTGFDFNGLKNAIGTFKKPIDTWIFPCFLKTLPREEILSGYAELIKHALLSDENLFVEALDNIELFTKLSDATACELKTCERMIWDSVKVKKHIVEMDPYEQKVRKSLNLGHTFGHALEELSFFNGTYLRHGYAVMYGLIAELYISYKTKGFNKALIDKLVTCVRIYYPTIKINMSEYDLLYEYMKCDKKNTNSQEINFTLLSSVGNYTINNVIEKEIIYQSLIFLENIF